MPNEVMRWEQVVADTWLAMVEAGHISTRFPGPDGKIIEAGVRRSPAGTLEDYARVVETGCELDVRVEQHRSGGFIARLSPIRDLKPRDPRPASIPRPRPSPNVWDCLFRCDDPAHPLSLLKRDPVLDVALKASRWRAFANAAPFEPEGHLLFVPSRVAGAVTVLPHYPQLLTETVVEDFVALARSLKGVVLFFNPLGGGASVDHVHFQAVCHRDRLAIQDADRITMGRYQFLARYPVNGVVFDLDERTADAIWPWAARLQTAGFPTHLVCCEDTFYVIPRLPAREIVDELPGVILASLELAGKIILPDRGVFERVKAGSVNLFDALSRTTPTLETVSGIFA